MLILCVGSSLYVSGFIFVVNWQLYNFYRNLQIQVVNNVVRVLITRAPGGGVVVGLSIDSVVKGGSRTIG